MKIDLTSIIAVYGAFLSTLSLGWQLFRHIRERIRLEVGAPQMTMHQQYVGGSSGKGQTVGIPMVSIPIRNPPKETAHVTHVYLRLKQGARIELKQAMAVGSESRPFSIEPRNTFNFMVWGHELAKQLEANGVMDKAEFTLEVENALGRVFKSKHCSLSINALKSS